MKAKNPKERRVAVVGIGCEYPDARTPVELWENILAQRRSFRAIPPERLRSEDYHSTDPSAPDKTYANKAALIEGYEFDRVRFRVAGSTYRSADLTHWLTLDVASRAFADAGFEDGKDLPNTTTGVLLGNTLTGEFSRASLMRLRWPYVRRVIGAMLKDRDWTPEQQQEFLAELESSYKAPFAPVGEDTLAGGLSNTIAGRVCNYYDLKGGGYTVDGACSSSLLAVATACTGLVSGDLDVALAGGVDLSLDPFEIVGFAKTKALAAGEMRVYDSRSAGFWPGEGCGLVVLMRYEDAVAQNRRVYATIRGWGISSDGSGGITRPELEGQILAMRRAYAMAGYGIDTVPFIEGHGTGTTVGDETELRVIATAKREAGSGDLPAIVGSVKANIGHTKAAAGVAGLIKAIMAVQQQIIPPTTASEIPHPVMKEESSLISTSSSAAPWSVDLPLRAGVSSMGFGGINAHLTLEGVATRRRGGLGPREEALSATAQDAELFLLDATDAASLIEQVEKLEELAPRLSRAELADLAAELESRLDGASVRAAIVASNPEQLAESLSTLRSWLDEGVTDRLDSSRGLYVGSGGKTPRLGFLFPGQGSPSARDAGMAQRRFSVVQDLYQRVALPEGDDSVWTAVAQPAIVTASVAGLRILEGLGLEASVALGHSLGELTALHWGGALDEAALLRVATARGSAMANVGGPPGAMGGISADPDRVSTLLEGEPVVVSGHNAPDQTTISGEADAVERVVERAKAEGLQAVRLKVSHAFHSPLMTPAVDVLKEHLSGEEIAPVTRSVVSTVTGAVLEEGEDIRALLCRQLEDPVRFTTAVSSAGDVDLFIEVGPGRVLSGLVERDSNPPAIPTEIGSASVAGLLNAVGASFALGAAIDHHALFADRVTRPFDLDRKQKFFVNPCELAPAPDGSILAIEAQQALLEAAAESAGAASAGEGEEFAGVPSTPQEVLELVRGLVANRVELPSSAVKDDHRLLDDLHLNSIVVGQLVTEAAGRMGLSPVVAPTEFADATVAEVARALEELARTDEGGGAGELDRLPPGLDTWLKLFTVDLNEQAAASPQEAQGGGKWEVIALENDPVAPVIKQKLTDWGREGVVVCLPPDAGIESIPLLLTGGREVLARREPTHFVLLQRGGGGAAFARCLHLEARDLTTTVVHVPAGHAKTADWVCSEVAASAGYTEAHYDNDGLRYVPVLHLLTDGAPFDGDILGPDDLLLVTGGGKGIASECALDLAKETGVRLALLGRSDPENDTRLAANLGRMKDAGVTYQYLSADVTDSAAVAAAVRRVQESLGPVTAILHAAGTNTPQLIRSLDEDGIRSTVDPKILGAENLFAAVDPKRLRLFITFGSILARTGLRGEADYALANEWLTDLTEKFQKEQPECRCLAVEWSLWSGVGMGERLGRVEALVRDGVTPITVDQGVRILRDLLKRKLPAVPVVAAGRFGEVTTLNLDSRELPLLRFLERPCVHYPGIELVAEADLSSDSDPYLDEHVFQGSRILPAVIGLEAMSQVAMTLAGATEPPVFEHVEFKRPVAVPFEETMTIRVAALVREPDVVEIVIRSGETSFQVDHFHAVCRFGDRTQGESTIKFDGEDAEAVVALEPGTDLYGDLLFQEGRFKLLESYRHLRATESVAVLSSRDDTDWFSRYLPPELVLGDPGVRDAVIHSIQACIPHARVLPVAVNRISPGKLSHEDAHTVRAHELHRDKDTFVYDIEVLGKDGSVLERWDQLKLRVLEERKVTRPWPVALLAPYIERRAADLLPGSEIGVAVKKGPPRKERGKSDAVIKSAIGRQVPVTRRPDGKPEVQGDLHVSASHVKDLTLAVASPSVIGCDMELAVTRTPAVWKDLLGDDRYELASMAAKESGESLDDAATRIWAVSECLKKTGAPVKTPLVLSSATEDGWVVVGSGRTAAATYVTAIDGREERLVLAILCERDEEMPGTGEVKGNDANV